MTYAKPIMKAVCMDIQVACCTEPCSISNPDLALREFMQGGCFSTPLVGVLCNPIGPITG